MMNAGLSEVVELRLQELFIRNEYAPSTLKTTLIKCRLCSVRNRMNDLIVNVALKPLYIHEEGGGNKI